ncbi:flagellar basal body P-ring formation chaperone FlgA [Celeribacter sp.]|uniref:flagellar basal body P-ring formation chaperone FlgA n=1 Tax=Celeribacter sp. TaxID=1890673 RepID=UPI003A8F5D4A
MIRACAIAWLAAFLPVFASAETVVAARTIRAQTVLSYSDLAIIKDSVPGMFVSVDEAIGLETKTVLYAGRPIRPEDVGPPAIVERNQLVSLTFQNGGLEIQTDARALTRAGVGDTVRVMNLNSKTIVTGIVASDGGVYVGRLPTK